MTETVALAHLRSPVADNPLSALKNRGKGVQFSLADVGAEAKTQEQTGTALGQVRPTATAPGHGNLLSASLIATLGS
ncbi:hypothetical protein GCM10011611_37020 [Aliidongia dinghuensis]|uniref:Uncharacterized protein n=1 Tax=Aliidongia dinghuensis TaxID=1867774 RepID=A0A8J2YW77_9PROT|nr:hypothetical protein [Aliidongia dinghuensis]GGF27594.1 hypothetical protein GCM10011611_37020 [Aliidongia dinghuensis]